jgi:hypothetical protein
MADNRHKYGFRFYASMTGVGRTSAIEGFIASGYAPLINTNVSVGLSIGDPVQRLTDGSFALAGDTTTTGAVPFGVIVGFNNVKLDYSATKARPASYYPTGVTYTTKANETRVAVLPFGRDLWEIDHLNGAFTTEAAYRGITDHNADLIYTLDAANPDKRRANPQLDLTTTGNATAHFRIFGISKTQENFDLSGANVKLLVQLNEGREPMFTATGLA